LRGVIGVGSTGGSEWIEVVDFGEVGEGSVGSASVDERVILGSIEFVPSGRWFERHDG
jgi:hypothetical protein